MLAAGMRTEADMSAAGIRERMELQYRAALGTPEQKKRSGAVGWHVARGNGKPMLTMEMLMEAHEKLFHLDEKLAAEQDRARNEIMCAYRHSEEWVETLRREGFRCHIEAAHDYARGLYRFEVVIDEIPEEMKEVFAEMRELGLPRRFAPRNDKGGGY